MATAEQLAPVGFSLAAALCWGTSDFSGGYASRRSDSFLVTALSHAGGFVLMLTLALITRPTFPRARVKSGLPPRECSVA